MNVYDLREKLNILINEGYGNINVAIPTNDNSNGRVPLHNCDLYLSEDGIGLLVMLSESTPKCLNKINIERKLSE
jgi:hypothetical protein